MINIDTIDNPCLLTDSSRPQSGLWGSQELDVQTSAGGDLASSATPELKTTKRLGGGIARGTAVIAALTIVARMFGLVRTPVFSQTVGASCLGTADATPHPVPNPIYERVPGGAVT